MVRLPAILALVFLCSAADAQPARCSKDSECAILPMVCPGCAPCEGAWYPAGNLAQKRRLEAEAASSRCAKPHCTCFGRWVGTGAICRARLCTPEHGERSDPRINGCKTDADCVPRPRSGCGCACGAQVEAAVNRAHAEWLQNEYARESCPKVKCAPCSTPSTTFKTRQVCHARRCTMVPR